MKRNLTLDLTRGFTVLCIAPIHSLLVYSRQDVAGTLTGKLLAFVAEWHGAQILMLLMGISITLKSAQTLQSNLKKAGLFLSAAFVLNILKFVIPYFLHGTPAELFSLLNVDPADHPSLHFLLIGDILQFAAIAYMISATIYTQKDYGKISIITAMAICFLSPFFYDTSTNNPVIDYVLRLFSGAPPQIFFPVLPWLVYPLLGLWIGAQLKEEKPFLSFDSFWIAGILVLIFSAAVKCALHDYGFSLFYRTTRVDTCIHVSATLIFLSVWHWISTHTRSNAIFQLLSYCSRNITLIYLIQWVLIMWLIPLFGFHKLGWIMSMMAMIAILFTTLALSLLFKLFFNGPNKATKS
jgi:hypothetical protein